MRNPRLLLALAATACLSACGGDGSTSPAGDWEMDWLRLNSVPMQEFFDRLPPEDLVEPPDTQFSLRLAPGGTAEMEMGASCWLLAAATSDLPRDEAKRARHEWSGTWQAKGSKGALDLKLLTPEYGSPLSRTFPFEVEAGGGRLTLFWAEGERRTLIKALTGHDAVWYFAKTE